VNNTQAADVRADSFKASELSHWMSGFYAHAIVDLHSMNVRFQPYADIG